MLENNEFPVKQSGISQAGITIQINPSGDNTEPFDVTLFFKKPAEGDIPDPDDENCFTAVGKLLFRFGKKGSVELFAEKTTRGNKAELDAEQEVL